MQPLTTVYRLAIIVTCYILADGFGKTSITLFQWYNGTVLLFDGTDTPNGFEEILYSHKVLTCGLCGRHATL